MVVPLSGKLILGYHSNSVGLGGADYYMVDLIRGLDPDRFDVILYAPSGHSFAPLVGGFAHVRISTVVSGENRPAGRDDPGKPCAGQAGEPQKPAVRRYGSVLRAALRRGLPPPVRLLVGELKSAIRYARLFRRDRLDILHTCEGGSEPAALGAAMARVPVRIASYCVLPTPPEEAGPGEGVRKFLERIAFRCLHAGIVKSESAGTEWRGRLRDRRDKIRVIHNGLDLDTFVPPDPATLAARRSGIGLGEGLVVGMTARLHPMKGHRYLLDAAPAVCKAVPGVTFLLVGDGSIRGDLESQVVRLGLKGSVRFLGHREDARDLTWLFDVAVLPSVAYETFGWAVIEAMACSKPVLASDFDGLPEVVANGETGILVPPGDSAALAAKLILLLQDARMRSGMGAAGRHRVKTHFGREKMLKSHFDLYESLVNSQGRCRRL